MSNQRRTDSSDRRQNLEDLMMSSSPHYRRKTRVKTWLKVSLKIIILLGLITGVVYGCLWLWNEYIEKNDDFILKEIEFHTNGHMTEMEVKHVLGLKGKENVLFLDTELLTEILKARPDIVKASVRRKVPATLVIDIEERVPIAWIECPQCGIHAHNEESGLMVDASGYLFRYDPLLHGRYKSSPVLQVMAPSDGSYEEGEWLEGRTTRRGLAFIQSLTQYYAEGLPPANFIDFPNEWSILCQFSNGMEITFGPYDYDRQLQDLITIMRYAESKGRALHAANLIPSVNIPIVYLTDANSPDSAETIVEAEIILEADPPPVPAPAPPPPADPAPTPRRNTGQAANTRNNAANTAATQPRTNTRNTSGASQRSVVRETNTRPATRQNLKKTTEPTPSQPRNNRPTPKPAPKPTPKPERKPVEVPSFNW